MTIKLGAGSGHPGKWSPVEMWKSVSGSLHSCIEYTGRRKYVYQRYRASIYPSFDDGYVWWRMDRSMEHINFVRCTYKLDHEWINV